MKISLKNQLETIFKSACYTAFGEIPQLAAHHQVQHIRFENKLQYKILIANAMYQSYRKDDFKFCDHGITPQGLAEDIQVHINHHNEDIQWQIDHFGNFVVKPTDQYLRKNANLKSFQFLMLQQYEKMEQKSTNISLQNHLHSFHFYADSKTTLGDLKRLKYMETRARILQDYNAQKVLRNFYTTDSEPSKQDYQTAQKVKKILFKQNMKTPSIQNIKKLQHVHKQQKITNYFCCCPSNLIHYQNTLPFFTILCPRIKKDSMQLITSIQNEKLIQLVSSQVGIDEKKKQQFEKLTEDITEGESVLLFGDLLDDYKFAESAHLLGKLKKISPQIFQVLNEAHQKINTIV